MTLKGPMSPRFGMNPKTCNNGEPPKYTVSKSSIGSALANNFGLIMSGPGMGLLE